MAMGRKTPGQPPLWIPHGAVSQAPGHTFYQKLNELLAEHEFDPFVEQLCKPFYASELKQGRRSIPPGVYFRMLLIGYFEGIESERGICWRCADSLSLRTFLGLELTDTVPDHSSLSRIRSRLDADVYHEVFRFILSIVEQHGLLRGKVVGVDSTYLRADASMRAIVRRETGEVYQEYLERLAKEAGIEEPTAEDTRRLDKKRQKRTSNKEWVSSTDPDAKVTRLKDGRTRLAHKAEHVVDLETGAIVSASIHAADQGDTSTIGPSLDAAAENIAAVVGAVEAMLDDDDDDPPTASSGGSSDKAEVVADKGYYSNEVLRDLEDRGLRSYIPEPKRRHRRRWKKKPSNAYAAFRNNQRRGATEKAKDLHRRRGELLERPFAHLCETGAARRTRLRGRTNIEKRYVLHAAAANLGLVLRTLLGHGTPRQLAEVLRGFFSVLFSVLAPDYLGRAQVILWRATRAVVIEARSAPNRLTPALSSTGC